MEPSLVLTGISVTAMLLIQTVTVVWFFAKLSSRVDRLEQDIARQHGANHPDRLIKIETIVEIVQKQQDEIKLGLDELRQGQLTRNAAMDQRYKRYEDTKNFGSSSDGG